MGSVCSDCHQPLSLLDEHACPNRWVYSDDHLKSRAYQVKAHNDRLNAPAACKACGDRFLEYQRKAHEETCMKPCDYCGAIQRGLGDFVNHYRICAARPISCIKCDRIHLQGYDCTSEPGFEVDRSIRELARRLTRIERRLNNS